MAAAERDQLQQRCDELTAEVAQLQQDSERQVEVIRQLMERSEVGSSTHQQLAQEVGQLQQHNKTLSVNLESHAQVGAGGLCWSVCWMSTPTAARSTLGHARLRMGAVASAHRTGR